MIRDVFYYGEKPNAHPRERFAKNLEHARQLSTTEHFWIINEYCDYRNFDWDFDFEFLADDEVWTKDHNNIWPSQHQKDSGTWLCPKVGGQYLIYRTDVDPVIRKPSLDNWYIPEYIDKSSFDFSWHPDPTSPDYIYEFATQHQPVGGPKYIIKDATQTKYMANPYAMHKVIMNNWVIPDNVDVSTFDFSWHPHPDSPAYIYIFGTAIDRNDGPKYVMSNATEISYMLRKDKQLIGSKLPKYYIDSTLEELVKKHSDEIFWALNKHIDYSDFNFDWLPLEHQSKFIHAFGTYDNIDTQTYFINGPAYVNGHRDINYVSDIKVNITTKLDMFFIDCGNRDAELAYSAIKKQFPNIKKTRYLNSWIDTVNRCVNKASTELFWVLDSRLDYSEFKFDYYPNPWQMNMLHIFGTQWGKWGTTFLINKNTFTESTKYLTHIEHYSGINFVQDRRAKTKSCVNDIVVINHGNYEIENVLQLIRNKEPNVNLSVVPYEVSYLYTLKNIVNNLPRKTEQFIWVISSICDYTNFDFTYVCDPYTKDMLHVFPSDNQKFGDTFLLEVNNTNNINEIGELTEYKINFNSHQRVNRLPAPIILAKTECLPDAITDKFDFPYAIYKTVDNADIEVNDTSINLWSDKDKNIIITSTSATTIVAPKEVYATIKREVYDYPYIIKSNNIKQSKPIDIVFLSNGEINADENYEHLLNVTRGIPNRIVRVDGIKGRAQAYHAALKASNTPWAFTVFAKLKVNKDFDWSWQPDRLQKQKHYIFYATNPVNGLVYGHQAMIAYNKALTLANKGKGLDFTLDDEHEVIELNSGVANYNTDAWSTWRTAFREAIKLRQATDIISKDRLSIWLKVGQGEYGEYSILGAKQGVQYHDSVGGDLAKLKLSYEWEWLKTKFENMVNLVQ